MAETFLSLKDKLADWLNIQTKVRLGGTVRGSIINMACRELLKNNRLRFGEVSTTLTFAADAWSVALPDRFVAPYHLFYVGDDNSPVFLFKMDREEFSADYPLITSTSDSPENYNIWQGNIYVGPTPAAERILSFDYYQYFAEMVEDSDTNLLVADAWEAVLFKGLTLVSMYMVEDMRVPMWEKAAEEHEFKLVQEHSRASSDGRRPISKIPG